MNQIKDFVRRHAFLLAVSAIWAVAVGAAYAWILRETGGRFIYNLDDAYIHLAIAKHIAQNGIWGVTPYGFSSSSSSILWPLLLAAAFRLIGDREIIPFLFALGASAGLIILLYREWIAREHRWGWVFAMLIGWMVFLPLGPILFNGMETMLHVLAAVALAAAAVRTLADEKSGHVISLCLLAVLVTAARYEGCFLAAAVCLLLLVRGHWKSAISVGLSAALPVVLYGLYSVGQGWSFLPNSLLIKHSGVVWSDPISLWNMAARPFQPITDIDSIHLPVWQSLAVVILMLLLARARSAQKIKFWDPRVLPAVLFLIAAAMHSLWITVEMFYRYQAYLHALGIWAIGCLGIPILDWNRLRRNPVPSIAAVFAAVLIAVPWGNLAIQAAWKTPVASRNIWQQQYQMGLFLREYYPQSVVAANDIGAIDYLTDIHLVDLFGLANREVLLAKQNGEWQRDLASALDRVTTAEGAQIAVIYDNWFGLNPETGTANVPAGWIRVAAWTIPGNVVCGGATVTWYAVRPVEADGLREALEQFSGRLPQAVTVQYYPFM